MKNQKIKERVASGLASILLSLNITKPSKKTRTYLRKVTKKLSGHLKADDKILRKKNKETRSVKAVKVASKNLKRTKKVSK